jgi:hypothetical protein
MTQIITLTVNPAIDVLDVGRQDSSIRHAALCSGAPGPGWRGH